MPYYRFECDTCGAGLLVHYPVEDAPKEVPCESCNGGHAVRQLPSRIFVNCNRVDFVTSDITGKPERVDTLRKHRELCERNGVREVTRDEIVSRRKAKKEIEMEPFEKSMQEVIKQTGQGWQEVRREKKKKRPRCAAV